jgi:hypothetical protein
VLVLAISGCTLWVTRIYTEVVRYQIEKNAEAMFGDYIRQARLGISMLAPLLVPISILGAARFGMDE